MARKGSDALFREQTIGTLTRVETHISTLLERQAEDRTAIAEALRLHMEQDAANFKALQEKHERTSVIINRWIGALLLLQFGVATAAAVGALKI